MTHHVTLLRDSVDKTKRRYKIALVPPTYIRKGVYYFVSDVDEQVFKQDTLKLVKDVRKGCLPRIHLKDTGQFCIDYNVKCDTTRYGRYNIKESDKIYGLWQSNDLSKRLTLSFSKEIINHYHVLDKGEYVYFIKSKS